MTNHRSDEGKLRVGGVRVFKPLYVTRHDLFHQPSGLNGWQEKNGVEWELAKLEHLQDLIQRAGCPKAPKNGLVGRHHHIPKPYHLNNVIAAMSLAWWWSHFEILLQIDYEYNQSLKGYSRLCIYFFQLAMLYLQISI